MEALLTYLSGQQINLINVTTLILFFLTLMQVKGAFKWIKSREAVWALLIRRLTNSINRSFDVKNVPTPTEEEIEN